MARIKVASKGPMSARKRKGKIIESKNVELSQAVKDKLRELGKKQPISERYVDLDPMKKDEYGRICAEIERRQWKDFTSMPGGGNLNVVREFYASFADLSKDDLSLVQNETKVRGMRIEFSPEMINIFYGTPSCADALLGDDVAILKKSNNYDKEDIMKVVCTEGTSWDNIKSNQFKAESKFWLHFVYSKLIPGQHTTEVTLDRILMVYCIMTQRKVDVGYTINCAINDAIRRKKKSLWFPNLITSLCSFHDVPTFAADVSIPPGEPLNHASFMRLRPKIVKEEGKEKKFKGKRQRKTTEAGLSNSSQLSTFMIKTSKFMEQIGAWLDTRRTIEIANARDLWAQVGLQRKRFREVPPPPRFEDMSSDDNLEENEEDENDEDEDESP